MKSLTAVVLLCLSITCHAPRQPRLARYFDSVSIVKDSVHIQVRTDSTGGTDTVRYTYMEQRARFTPNWRHQNGKFFFLITTIIAILIIVIKFH